MQENNCTFEGRISSPPLFTNNILHFVIGVQSFGETVPVPIYASGFLASTAHARLSMNDTVFVQSSFSPVKTDGKLVLRFIAYRIVIMTQDKFNFTLQDEPT